MEESVVTEDNSDVVSEVLAGMLEPSMKTSKCFT
jgi:hypothetical protein